MSEEENIIEWLLIVIEANTPAHSERQQFYRYWARRKLKELCPEPWWLPFAKWLVR